MSTIFFLYHISLKTNSYSFLSSYTFFLGYLRCIFFLFLLRCIPPAPLLYSANPENLAQEPSPLFLPSVRQSTNFAGQILFAKQPRILWSNINIYRVSQNKCSLYLFYRSNLTFSFLSPKENLSYFPTSVQWLKFN